jgi:hypothetical protein
MRQMLNFEPFPLLTNKHLQTILPSFLPREKEPPSRTTLVHLEDGDKLALEVATPASWQPKHGTVVLVHGLASAHCAPYMARIAYKLFQRGIRSVRMNMRGCGSGHGLARQIYHGGRSEDVLAVLQTLAQSEHSPTALIGFSLGGNQVLKLAGELGAKARDYLEQVIALCPPANMSKSARLLASPSNRLYDQHFLKKLIADVTERQQLFPDLPKISFPKKLNLIDFDNLYTAPRCGFKDAEDYYSQSSAAPLIPNIKIPCHILFALDDPFIDATACDDLELPGNVTVYFTNQGGHLGFLGLPPKVRWLDEHILSWLGLAPLSIPGQEARA